MRWPWRRPMVGDVVPVSVEHAVEASRMLGAALCVSIADPDRRLSTDHHIEGIACPVWRVDIDDIERPAPGCVAPSLEAVVGVLERCRALPIEGVVLVHCQAGVSRSAAFALGVAVDKRLRAGWPKDRAVRGAVSQVGGRARAIRPNMAIASLLSEVLDLEDTDWMERVWAFHRG